MRSLLIGTFWLILLTGCDRRATGAAPPKATSDPEVPTLLFDEGGITWRQVFEAGFRPKHLDGLEDTKCVSHNQSFLLQFKDREPLFRIERGRLQFVVKDDEFIRMIWHQGADPITLEEGKRRAAAFRKVFDGHIIQEITMPRLIDPSGLVDSNNDENNIKARVGKYLIWYGFDNSMGKVTPIIPHFYISYNFPGRPDEPPRLSRDPVRPPAGFEWYSLDPKVSTPDPQSKKKSEEQNKP